MRMMANEASSEVGAQENGGTSNGQHAQHEGMNTESLVDTQNAAKPTNPISLPGTPQGSSGDGIIGRKGAFSGFGTDYGMVKFVSTTGNFPQPGSTLGPYFSVGRLGKGTFCSIHRCINLGYHHKSDKPQCREVAAKIEVGEFRNSGVLQGEATMLDFLDSSLPKGTVPTYMGHYRGGDNISAIVMEYLPGNDMHQIRDAEARNRARRVSIEDAVYLTADVMLPLLRRMHEVGIVHRDVKPSNCVKREGKEFAMVDFGLSKSIVVPADSTLSDGSHPWPNETWLRPPNGDTKGSLRQERQKADFRGTSMYASLRVHQLKDYCPRDDIWSLMYVFCDLVSGGLPWMNHAANRDRQACQDLKERIHGDKEGTVDQTEQMLMGQAYYNEFYRLCKGGINLPEDTSSLPPPLSMANDSAKVQALRDAFDHLKGLMFADLPDYELISQCIRSFLKGSPQDDDDVAEIKWVSEDADMSSGDEAKSVLQGPTVIPEWTLPYLDDALDSTMFAQAQAEALLEQPEAFATTTDDNDVGRLPLEFQFRISQMEYNRIHKDSIDPAIAARDWFQVALPLLYGEWRARDFEKGGHRLDSDGFRRELYLRLIRDCLKCAKDFGFFQDRRYIDASVGEVDASSKRRRVSTSAEDPQLTECGSDLVMVSRAIYGLQMAEKLEQEKKFAPPPRLSFGNA